MDRGVTPHERVTSPTWSPPPPHLHVDTPQVCKQFAKVCKVQIKQSKTNHKLPIRKLRGLGGASVTDF